MAQKKISDYPALTAADAADILEITDVSANTTKKITPVGLAAGMTGAIGTTQLADDAVTPPKAGDLAKAVNRKDNTTNNTVTDQLIQSGWSYLQGAGVAFVTGTLTFPVAFDDVPMVFINTIGRRDTAAVPTSPNQYTLDSDMYAHVNSVTTTGANVSIESVSAGVQSSGRQFGYSWIAIGTKAR